MSVALYIYVCVYIGEERDNPDRDEVSETGDLSYRRLYTPSTTRERLLLVLRRLRSTGRIFSHWKPP